MPQQTCKFPERRDRVYVLAYDIAYVFMSQEEFDQLPNPNRRRYSQQLASGVFAGIHVKRTHYRGFMTGTVYPLKDHWVITTADVIRERFGYA